MKHMWSEEEIQSFKKDISNLVDSKGNPRFVEGEGTPATIEGFEASYCKWSLSGTHLMLVLAGNIANETTISNGTILATFTPPKYILNKIYKIVGDIVEYKNVSMYASDYSSQSLQGALLKGTNSLEIRITNSVTLTKDRTYRLQYDYLIDSE